MYRRETSIAEKLEAMVKLGILNSRMKDFYDVWALSREFAFEGGVLSASIRATFVRRSTTLAARVPLALSDSFANDPMKRRQWQAFAKRGRLRLPTTSFAAVVEANRTFLMPAVDRSRGGEGVQRPVAQRGPLERQGMNRLQGRFSRPSANLEWYLVRRLAQCQPGIDDLHQNSNK